MACLGLDADVANNISFIRKKKWIPVSQRYNASLVYSYFKYKFKDLKITMGETQVENSCTILAVGNGQYYGGGFRIAPHALLEDGMFDIYFVEKLPKPKIIPILIKLLRGKHENSEYVTRFSGNKIIIDTDELCTFNVDGEKMTSNHFEIINISGGIKVYNDRNFIDEILQKRSTDSHSQCEHWLRNDRVFIDHKECHSETSPQTGRGNPYPPAVDPHAPSPKQERQRVCC